MKRSIDSPKQVFPASLRLAGEACREKRPGKGRLPISRKRLYVALWLFRVYFALPYRAVEPMLQDRFPDQPCPRFPAWRWFLQTKGSWALLQRLFQRLKQELSPLLPQEEEPVLWALDASGFFLSRQEPKNALASGEAAQGDKGAHAPVRGYSLFSESSAAPDRSRPGRSGLCFGRQVGSEGARARGLVAGNLVGRCRV